MGKGRQLVWVVYFVGLGKGSGENCEFHPREGPACLCNEEEGLIGTDNGAQPVLEGQGDAGYGLSVSSSTCSQKLTALWHLLAPAVPGAETKQDTAGGRQAGNGKGLRCESQKLREALEQGWS